MAKKKKTKAKKFSGTKVLTKVFRASFVSVFKKRAFDDGDTPKYELTMLFPKSTDLSELKRVAKLAEREKFGKKRPKNFRSPFQGELSRSD